MNQIWYTIETVDGVDIRTICHVGRLDDYNDLKETSKKYMNNVYLDVDYRNIQSLITEDIKESSFYTGEYGLAQLFYDHLMCKGDESLTVKQLISQENYGRLRLIYTRDDNYNRGELGDFRYHGSKFDHNLNIPIMADDVPYTRGGFAMQVIRMIKSGLINKPIDDSIIGNEEHIVKKLRTNLKGDSYAHPQDVQTNKIVYELNKQLTSKGSLGEKSPMQIVLDTLYTNDPPTFHN